MKSLENPKKGKVIIETGHKYIRESEVKMSGKEIVLTEFVSDFLKERGFGNTMVVLFDDVKSNENSLAETHKLSPPLKKRVGTPEERRVEIRAALARGEMRGLSADELTNGVRAREIRSNLTQGIPEDYDIWYEADYMKEAKAVIEELKERLRKNPNNELHARLSGADENRIKIGSNKDGQNITLFQPFETDFDAMVFIPSCPVLDLCVYQQKLEEAEMAVTLLPVSFKEQQAEVRSLFAILGQSPAVIVLYYDPETFATVEVESWNKQYDSVAEELKESAHSVANM